MKAHRPLMFLAVCLLATLACRLADDMLSDSADTSPVATAEVRATSTPLTLSLATEAPLQVDSAFVRFDDPQLGLSLEYPAGWYVEPGESTLIIAPDIATLNEPALAPASVIIISIESESGLSADDLATLSPDLVFEAKALEEREATPLESINGQEAALREYSATIAGERRNLVVYGIAANSQALILLGATPEDSPDGRRVADIAASITLRRPEPHAPPVAAATLTRGDEVAGVVADGERWVAAFDGSEGDFVAIVVETVGDFDAVVDILTDEGVSLVEGGIDEAFDTERVNQLQLLEDGTYFLVVRGFGGVGGAFNVALDNAEVAADWPGLDEATPLLSEGQAYSAAVAQDEVHFYRIEASDSRPLRFIADGQDDFDAELTLFDGEGFLLLDIDEAYGGESESFVFTPSAPGVYILQVGGFLGSDGAYTVGMVAMVESGTAVLQAEGYVDRSTPGQHRFTVPGGQAALIVVTPAKGLDVIVSLYDDGVLLVERDDLSSAAGEVETHIFAADGSSELLLELTPFSGDGTYSVVITVAELDERP